MNIAAVQWSKLDHIADVRPIGDQDETCLKEIQDVLKKHGFLDRFGVALLHNHFDLSDEEIMMETTDLDNREHMVRPVTKAELKAEGITAQSTIVCFDENGMHQACGCDPRASGHYHK